MRRFLASGLATVSLFVLILAGCGGTSSVIGDTSGSDTSGSTGSALVPAGNYTEAFMGSNNATEPANFSGSGSGTVAADGTITLTYTSSASSDSRILTAKATTANSVIGTLQVGSNAPFETLVTLTDTSGVYKVRSVFTLSGVTETDDFTLTAVLPASGTYTGTHAGTDNKGGTFSGAVLSSSVGATGALDAPYVSTRTQSGAGVTQNYELLATLNADKSVTGKVNLGLNNVAISKATWSTATGKLVVTFTYVNRNFTPNPTVTETLTLTKQ